MIVDFLSDFLSLSAALGCACKTCCGVANSAGCPVVVESKDLSAFAAQDLRVRDREAVRALMVIDLAPLYLHRPGNTVITVVD